MPFLCIKFTILNQVVKIEGFFKNYFIAGSVLLAPIKILKNEEKNYAV